MVAVQVLLLSFRNPVSGCFSSKQRHSNTLFSTFFWLSAAATAVFGPRYAKKLLSRLVAKSTNKQTIAPPQRPQTFIVCQTFCSACLDVVAGLERLASLTQSKHTLQKQGYKTKAEATILVEKSIPHL